MKRRNSILILPMLVVALFGCRKSAEQAGSHADAAHAPKAEVDHPQSESSLTTVRLSASAESHLQIETVPVKRQALPNHRTYGAEIIIPEGRSIVLSAPMSGTIEAVEDMAFPMAGVRVGKGDALLRLAPSIRGRGEVLNPSDRIALARARADLEAARVQAAGDVDAAEVRVEATRIALERAERLVEQNAGSRRALDEARGEHRLANAGLEAAKARKGVLDETLTFLAGDGEDAALTINAPFDGVVRRLLVARDEVVAAGAQLCEVAATDPLWVRVSVYVGDLSRLATDTPARAPLMGGGDKSGFVLQPVAAPPTGNATTTTVDLYYSFDNAGSTHQPGERCVVDIPADGEGHCRVIPQSAVVYDIHGDSWVYVAIGGNAFVRRRVAIRRIVEGLADVADGLDEGEDVVTLGAAELFGVEFGNAGH